VRDGLHGVGIMVAEWGRFASLAEFACFAR
jgi:hypothetical protein